MFTRSVADCTYDLIRFCRPGTGSQVDSATARQIGAQSGAAARLSSAEPLNQWQWWHLTSGTPSILSVVQK